MLGWPIYGLCPQTFIQEKSAVYGGIRIMAITLACGAKEASSILVYHPNLYQYWNTEILQPARRACWLALLRR